MTNTDGLVTTIARDSSGTATAIIAPNGQTTMLAMGPDGYLAQIVNPAGDPVSFTYGATGLLATHTDLRGGSHIFTFDGDGRLTKDEGPDGAFWQLSRTGGGTSFSVVMTTAEGHQETHTTTVSSTGTTFVGSDTAFGNGGTVDFTAGTNALATFNGNRSLANSEYAACRFGRSCVRYFAAGRSKRRPPVVRTWSWFASRLTRALKESAKRHFTGRN